LAEGSFVIDKFGSCIFQINGFCFIEWLSKRWARLVLIVTPRRPSPLTFLAELIPKCGSKCRNGGLVGPSNKIAAVLQIIGRNFGVLFGPAGCREIDQKQNSQPNAD